MTALDNKHIMGKYKYPNNMEETLKLLENYKVVRGGSYQTTALEST